MDDLSKVSGYRRGNASNSSSPAPLTSDDEPDQRNEIRTQKHVVINSSIGKIVEFGDKKEDGKHDDKERTAVICKDICENPSMTSLTMYGDFLQLLSSECRSKLYSTVSGLGNLTEICMGDTEIEFEEVHKMMKKKGLESFELHDSMIHNMAQEQVYNYVLDALKHRTLKNHSIHLCVTSTLDKVLTNSNVNMKPYKSLNKCDLASENGKRTTRAQFVKEYKKYKYDKKQKLAKMAEYQRLVAALNEANVSMVKIIGLTLPKLKRFYEKHRMETALKNAGMCEKEIAQLKPRELKLSYEKNVVSVREVLEHLDLHPDLKKGSMDYLVHDDDEMSIVIQI